MVLLKHSCGSGAMAQDPIFSTALARGLVLLAMVGVVALGGCPLPPPDGQSPQCAAMMACWYSESALVSNPQQTPVRFTDGGLLQENELQLIREHYGEEGACWKDSEFAVVCTEACQEALVANCAGVDIQCLAADGTRNFDSRVANDVVKSCDDLGAGSESP